MKSQKKYNKQINYLKAIIICHGASEYHIARHLKSNLRLKIEVDGKDNGEHSIQINSILNFLNTTTYVSEHNFIKKFKDVIPNGKIHPQFKIFIIMDTDDEELTHTDIENFKNKNMFRGHWAYNYIEPIFNTRNLEEVLIKAKIIDDKHKKKDYIKLFPINHNATTDDIKEIEILKEKLEHINNTNLDVLLEYLLNLVK